MSAAAAVARCQVPTANNVFTKSQSFISTEHTLATCVLAAWNRCANAKCTRGAYQLISVCDYRMIGPGVWLTSLFVTIPDADDVWVSEHQSEIHNNYFLFFFRISNRFTFVCKCIQHWAAFIRLRALCIRFFSFSSSVFFLFSFLPHLHAGEWLKL